MHPDPAYRTRDRDLMETLIEEIGFGIIFASTPQGPRVVHAPLISTGDGAVQFHISSRNMLAEHLAGETALVVVNGPDAYVSPRWYVDRGDVPTWNYVALELEGRVRRMDVDGLNGQLQTLIARHEERVHGGRPWSLDDVPEADVRAMLGGIVGFEMEVQDWRATMKLSQNRSAADRQGVIHGLEDQGANAMAHLMRTLAP